MIYGVLCFAIFFSFVGTVLGGLWADDSWGRFWGWDPKENGALIIVIWNALVLHARWDGMVKDRGLAVLAIGGNIAVAWSGFGVNELGAGLHSYGFTQGVAFWLAMFVAQPTRVDRHGLAAETPVAQLPRTFANGPDINSDTKPREGRQRSCHLAKPSPAFPGLRPSLRRAAAQRTCPIDPQSPPRRLPFRQHHLRHGQAFDQPIRFARRRHLHFALRH